MTHEVVWLAEHLTLGEIGNLEEHLIDVDNSPSRISFTNDQVIFLKFAFDTCWRDECSAHE